MPMSRHSVGDLSGNKLTRKLSGNIRPQSSRLAEPVWTDPGIKSENSARELISTLKKKQRRREMEGRSFSPNPHKREKSHHHVGKFRQNCNDGLGGRTCPIAIRISLFGFF